MLFNWLTNSPCLRPSAQEPAADNASPSAKPFAPLSHAQGFPVVSNKPAISLIPGLLHKGRPPAIFRGVRAININSIKALSIRSNAHIGEEVIKGIYPSVANGYPPSSVVFEAVIAFDKASTAHCNPSPVCGCVSHSVGAESGDGIFYTVATARNSASFGKVSSGYGLDRSARTYAVPHNCYAIVFCSGQHRKLSERLTSKVYRFFAHFVTSKLLTVNGAWQSAVRQSFGSYPSQAKGILA